MEALTREKISTCRNTFAEQAACSLKGFPDCGRCFLFQFKNTLNLSISSTVFPGNFLLEKQKQVNQREGCGVAWFGGCCF